MACTTILVGKLASYDGSCIIARNDDSPAGRAMPKKTVIISGSQQPLKYRSVISHVTIDLPSNPLTYSATPNAKQGEGIWCAAGINSANVAMSATETITSNPRVLAADPLVVYQPASNENEEKVGGIGEEDLVHIVLPYIHSAREGVHRLGSLLEQYGTYECNGIAFADEDEIWYFETIGGHHWMAARVPDDSYVVMPNQLGIDKFDFDDAFVTQQNYMCSNDLKEFMTAYHLDLTLNQPFNPRQAFGSTSDSDHVYNTPRAWVMCRYFNPTTYKWDGLEADYQPESDNIPWSLVPERKITIEDVKYILSNHYQGTPYDPYLTYGDRSNSGKYRCIGINRTDFLGILQVRSKKQGSIEWVCYGSNVFNVLIPLYTQVSQMPDYLSCTNEDVNTNSFYWVSRLIGGIADATYNESLFIIERYQLKAQSEVSAVINHYDPLILRATNTQNRKELASQANKQCSDIVEKMSQKVLNQLADVLTNHMKNSFVRSDN